VREANLAEFKETRSSSLASAWSRIPRRSWARRARGRPGESETAYTARIHGGNSKDAQPSLPRGNSLYETPNLDGIHQWGMSIDLNTCIGCNACIIACQAENNIPIGPARTRSCAPRDAVDPASTAIIPTARPTPRLSGARATTPPEDPQVSMQPMTCQHCELRRARPLCPVNPPCTTRKASTIMAYNRCIGTAIARTTARKVRAQFLRLHKRATDAPTWPPRAQSRFPELLSW